MINEQDRELMRRLANHILEVLETDITLNRDKPRNAVIRDEGKYTGKVDYCPNCDTMLHTRGICTYPMMKYCPNCGQAINQMSLLINRPDR